MVVGISYTIYIDAQYVINCCRAQAAHYTNGTNGDMWRRSSLLQSRPATSTKLTSCGAPAASCGSFCNRGTTMPIPLMWMTFLAEAFPDVVSTSSSGCIAGSDPKSKLRAILSDTSN